MKRLTLFLAVAALFSMDIHAQQTEYQIVTVVESIVPMGLGRSRIIEETQDGVESQNFTTARTDGKGSDQKDVKRKDLKIDNFQETKLLNFYSAGGINFQNIASNDAIISSKINDLVAEGWELAFVTSAVEGDGGETDGNGIFITRLIFKRTR